MASLALIRAQRSAGAADIAGAMSLEALQGTPTSFHPAIQPLRPHPGPGAKRGDAPRAARRSQRDRRVPPLLRQGAGRVLAPLHAAGARREPRPRSATSSAPSRSSSTRHRQPARLARRRADRLRRQLPRPADRDGARLPRDRPAPSSRASASAAPSASSTRSLSDGLPPFLVAREEGLNSGFMIPQYVAAALVSREQGALPSREPSTRSPRAPARRTTSRWGTAPGLKALQVIANAERVLAIELLARRPGGRVPCAARAGRRCSRRARASFGRCPTASERIGLCRRTSSVSPARLRTDGSSARSCRRPRTSTNERSAASPPIRTGRLRCSHAGPRRRDPPLRRPHRRRPDQGGRLSRHSISSPRPAGRGSAFASGSRARRASSPCRGSRRNGDS